MLVRLLVGTGAATQPDADAHAETGARPRAAQVLAASLFRAVLLATFPFSTCLRGRGAGGALLRNGEAARDRIQVEHLANEVAQRDHELCGSRRAPCG